MLPDAFITPAQTLLFPHPTLGRGLCSSCYYIQSTLTKHLAVAGTMNSIVPTLPTALGGKLFFYFTNERTKAGTYLRYDLQTYHVSPSLLASGLELVKTLSNCFL